MGLAILVLGLVVFLGIHVLVACRAQRASIIGSLGEVPYKVVFSVVSIVGVLLIGYGFGLYRATGWIDVWYPPVWTRHITVALVWPAIIFVTAAYLPGRIKTALKHPMLVGVKLWAAGHLIANGDLGSIILFGSFLAWAVVDRISLKYRADLGAPPIPYGGRRNDYLAIVVGTILYFSLGLVFHPLVIGVPAFGTPALGT